MSLLILLLASIASLSFLISGQALLFWKYKRRTSLVWAQVVFFACTALNYAAVTLAAQEDDLRRWSVIFTRLFVLGASAYYLYQYHRRNVDY